MILVNLCLRGCVCHSIALLIWPVWELSTHRAVTTWSTFVWKLNSFQQAWHWAARLVMGFVCLHALFCHFQMYKYCLFDAVASNWIQPKSLCVCVCAHKQWSQWLQWWSVLRYPELEGSDLGQELFSDKSVLSNFLKSDFLSPAVSSPLCTVLHKAPLLLTVYPNSPSSSSPEETHLIRRS